MSRQFSLHHRGRAIEVLVEPVDEAWELWLCERGKRITLGGTVLYKLVYTADGLLDGAVRFTDSDTVAQWREFIERLYTNGEELASFFERRVAGLTPPHVQ